MKAFVGIPPVAELYPYGAVCTGLRTMGVDLLPASNPLDGDLLVTWSPWKRSRREAIYLHYQREKRPIIVMENGWLSPLNRSYFYQIARDGWNGTGYFADLGTHRWNAWGVECKPWKAHDLERVALIAGQRGHPWDDRSSPPGWHEKVQLPGLPEHRIIRRPRDASVPLDVQLGIATELHTWSSNAASHAIVAGVPVIQHGPNLAVAALASRPGEILRCPDREAELARLAWSQFRADEIATGEPFQIMMMARRYA
jgi:hypothetical protein